MILNRNKIRKQIEADLRKPVPTKRPSNPVKNVFGFVDFLSQENKKAKQKRPFGRIKDRPLFEGFW